jgi:hypothetical protein
MSEEHYNNDVISGCAISSVSDYLKTTACVCVAIVEKEMTLLRKIRPYPGAQ